MDNQKKLLFWTLTFFVSLMLLWVAGAEYYGLPK